MDCIFIFRRDLRLEDNTALNYALNECDRVIPVFIADPRQLINNPYKSEFAVSFMINSLLELDDELRKKGSRLNVFFGEAEKVVGRFFNKVDAIYVNKDYTPFSISRDEKIRSVCEENGIEFREYEDYLLTPKSLFHHKNFTSFYNEVKKIKVREPETMEGKFDAMDSSMSVDFLLTFKKIESPLFHGGRKEGLYLLHRNVDFSRRDYPAENNNFRLSPHLKFGTISIREAYYAQKNNEEFIRELYWRDFFTLLAYYNPYVFGHCYRKEYDNISWENNESYFEVWKEGRTGYPIIDAGMRMLNSTGYINGRVRMLVAFFLVKVLFVDWRWGERYFATKLVDYDPAINNGNWQWVASTGVDYVFRVFNPWKQQEKFDPEAKFIKEWVEELKDVPSSIIHSIYRTKVPGYPSPIVNWLERVNYVKSVYRSIKTVNDIL
ncbi:cryptochrome/photolyase family protein [Sulfurisphaera ohwakuensis]|uniref:Deoxyribodipyrimidine photo-lyase n=1 Tax=Sulfurisphaera ohwakuensis TaxID=69656 RepID=A0A650CG71_SULOH|nr:deoxyribodipyrimidine photo-lyase [Sulfurisphaera ohwakuensis]MBB5254164.1 deoxyribodipyrimidine photo-lyase [Sulfurisphaera ohwakuensis]QGR16537.1 deoxyribodipyrimidine photo-lyase [Sulfurisphaera ohwakuensis]